jgi:hypothetical protein
MPHIPQFFSSTLGAPKHLTPVSPVSDSPSVPAQASKPKKLSIGLPKISPHTYVPDQDLILKAMLGDFDVDTHTGLVVRKRRNV